MASQTQIKANPATQISRDETGSSIHVSYDAKQSQFSIDGQVCPSSEKYTKHNTLI